MVALAVMQGKPMLADSIIGTRCSIHCSGKRGRGEEEGRPEMCTKLTVSKSCI